MNIAMWKTYVKRTLFLLRKKGAGYTFKAIYFFVIWGRRYPLITRLFSFISPYPKFIEIEVTTRCNLRCTLCEHTYWNEPVRDMSLQEFKSIIDQFPHLQWIGLTGIGESFLNKDFLSMLAYVKAKNVFVELYDTFYLIDAVTSERLIEMGIDRMYVSFDGATKETYEKIRVNSNFEQVVENIKGLLNLKRQLSAHFPEVHFHYIITKDNISEMLQYLELVRSLIVDQSVTVQFTRMLHTFKEVDHLFTEISPEVIREVEDQAQKLSINLSWNLNVPVDKPPLKNCIEWTMPFIFATGHVIPCCAGNESGRRDFQKDTSLGNIFEQSFKDIWLGRKYKAFRRMLRVGHVPVQCRNCCIYHIKGNN
ncbi:MAG: radical SAM protein [Candidatus Omnitrophota bacterium]